MKKSIVLIITATLTLTACSDDNSNNGTSNNGTNNGTADAGDDGGYTDAPSDADGDSQMAFEVESIQPTKGALAGGTQVTISGTGFANGAKVFFGGTEAEVSDTTQYRIDAKTPPGAEAGTVDVVVENYDGERKTLTDGFEYVEEGPNLTVGWCTIQHPMELSVTAGTATEDIFGRVYVEGCTDGDTECEVIDAQLGYGDPTVDPTQDSSGYTWVPATYNADHTADDNDEFQANFTPTAVGPLHYAYRFSVDGGTTWTYCDRNGSEDGFSLDDAGDVTVEEDTTTPTVEIGWCRLQWPESTTTTAGSDTENIYGRVYSDGCTDGDAECTEISAQVGFGPSDGDPTSDAGAYTWVDATYNAGHTSDNNDEFQAVLSPQTEGTYTYAYRFSGDGGTTWTYCDFDDAGGFVAANMGTLTVDP